MRSAASAPKVCFAAASAVAVLAAMGSAPPVSPKADTRPERRSHRERFSKVGEAGDESVESRIGAEQFAQARTAPGVVLPGAYSAAFASLASLPVLGRAWSAPWPVCCMASDTWSQAGQRAGIRWGRYMRATASSRGWAWVWAIFARWR